MLAAAASLVNNPKWASQAHNVSRTHTHASGRIRMSPRTFVFTLLLLMRACVCVCVCVREPADRLVYRYPPMVYEYDPSSARIAAVPTRLLTNVDTGIFALVAGGPPTLRDLDALAVQHTDGQRVSSPLQLLRHSPSFYNSPTLADRRGIGYALAIPSINVLLAPPSAVGQQRLAFTKVESEVVLVCIDNPAARRDWAEPQGAGQFKFTHAHSYSYSYAR